MALFVVGAYNYCAFVVDSYYSSYYLGFEPLAALEGHSYYS